MLTREDKYWLTRMVERKVRAALEELLLEQARTQLLVETAVRSPRS